MAVWNHASPFLSARTLVTAFPTLVVLVSSVMGAAAMDAHDVYTSGAHQDSSSEKRLV